ncbi:MAG: WD40 repeat domain-containing protein [Gemmataceae bacterium]|nr:WD40 repeat domain-containing protein [Gemmataceae bacterium]
MRSLITMILLGCFAVMLCSEPTHVAGKDKDKAKDKEKDKDKKPAPLMPPVINPAIAKIDFTVTGLDGPGFAIAAGESGTIVVGCENGTLQAYKKEAVAAFRAGTAKPDVWKGHDGPVRVAVWTGGPTLVSAGADKKVNFWSLPDGKKAQTATVDFRVLAGAMSKDGKIFAVGGESESIQLFDVATGKPTAKLTDKMDWTLALAFSADGKQMLSGDYLGVVRLWDVGGKKIAELPAKPVPAPKTPPDPVSTTSVAFGPDGKTAFIGTADGPIQVVNLGDGKIARTLVGHTGPVTGMIFHPTGTLLATVSKDRTVKLWNPAAAPPLKSLDGHTAWIEGVAFIDENTKLATVSADQTIKIWDLAEPPKKK